ncbi:Hypothetical predicted protein [Paramuricea clavata]|uniref:Uncharacterized protein n=1 Tax=Paramuricea clavata TaxID=317549 RepID=A0A7D9JLD8_PARCT|nr:Hypothetical predicted protein [Paramuricea clavata]
MGNKITKHIYGFESQENENHEGSSISSASGENYHSEHLVQIRGRNLPLLWEQDPNNPEPVIHPPTAPVCHDNVREINHQRNESSASSETDFDSDENDSDENHLQAEDAQMVNQQSVQDDKNHVAMVYSPVYSPAIHDQLPLQESEAQPQVVGNVDLEMEVGGVIVLHDENVQDEVLVTTIETKPAIVEEL